MNVRLCRAATTSIFFLPKMVAISMRASTSSEEAKKGKRQVRKLSRIPPTDQISSATNSNQHRTSTRRLDAQIVWSGHLSNTSGALNPLVPARFARTLGLRSNSGLKYPTLPFAFFSCKSTGCQSSMKSCISLSLSSSSSSSSSLQGNQGLWLPCFSFSSDDILFHILW